MWDQVVYSQYQMYFQVVDANIVAIDIDDNGTVDSSIANVAANYWLTGQVDVSEWSSLPDQYPRDGYVCVGIQKVGVDYDTTVYDFNDEIYVERGITHFVGVWERSEPATSITLSVTPGYDSVTVTAKLNPSSTTTDSVTWTRSSGSAGSITNEGSLSATVSLNDSGTVTIKATADDASKRSASITIRVSELSFNANGGSGAPSTMLYGQSTTSSHSFTIPSSEPYRSGFTFLGWSTSSSGNATYDPGDTISVSSSSNRTLYAVWGGDASITFHANGGSGGPGSETYYDIKASGSTSVTLPSSQPSRSGWIFQGWATSSSATSASYSANGSYSLTAGDSDDLYAVWAKSTTLAYDTNGGSGNFSSSDYTIPEYGSQSVSISSTKPTHPYMDFSGWLYNGRTYQPGASLTLQPGQDVVLTAQWTAKSYTLKFDIGNGSGSFPDKTGTSSTGTCSFQLDGREPTAPSGYVFKGWATTSGGNVVYSASGSVAVSVNSNPMTLYAVYEPLPTYTLSFDANNGQNAPSSMQAQANADGEAEFQLTGAVPTRTGYTFMGWSFQSNAVSATYGASDRVTLTESDTLYAVWMPKLVTSIDITADESVLVGGSIQVTASAVPSDALQCGITFMISIGGQYATITSQQQTPTGGTATITGVDNGTITVTATAVDGSQVTASVQIDVEQRITVSYNGNGGSGVPTSHYVDTVQDSASITLSGTVPVWNGMIFKGWSEDQQAESAQYQPGQAYTFSKSTTLFAVWEPEKVLVTDITITCNLTMKVGDEITVTATGLPPEADERGVTFTITTGGDLVQIVSQSPTDDGGTMQLKAIGHGVVTITATANDGSGVYATKNVTVEQTLVLSYDLDGGQNGPSQQSHDTSSDSHVFTIGTEEPTKSGFEFMGWDSDGNGQADKYPGNTIEISHNTTLKAVWAVINHFELRYDIGDGTGSFDPETYDGIETSYEFGIKSPGPTPPAGYRFLGWSTTDGGSVEYQSGGQYEMGSPGTVTLYAVYELITYQHTLIYDAGAGSNAPTVDPVTNTDEVYQWPVTEAQPTPPAGYTFVGWADESGSPEADYTYGDTIPVGETKTVYAVYAEKVYEHVIKLDANGGSNLAGPITVRNTQETFDWEITEDEPTPPAGYRFVGWADSADAEQAQYHAGDTVSVGAERTLYAVYELITYDHELIYDAGEGSNPPVVEPVNNTSEVYDWPVSETVPTAPEGYRFVGWADEQGADTPDYVIGGIIPVGETKTVYAVYELITYEHTLIYDAGAGSNAPIVEPVTNTDEVYQWPVAEEGPLPPEGYRFLGWADEQGADTPDYLIGGTIPVGETKTVYAVYELITYDHELIYDPVEGTFDGQSADEPFVDSKTTVLQVDSFSVTDKVPTRQGYAFVGWSVTEGDEEATYHAGDRVEVSDTLTLYAVWREAIVHITSVAPSEPIMSGDAFSYQVTADVDGVAVTFQSEPAAEWLSVEGGRLFGVPAREDAGSYEITVTASLDGWESATQTFTLVVETTVHAEPPVAGAMVYVTDTSDSNAHSPKPGYIDLGTYNSGKLTFQFAGEGADAIEWRIVGPDTDLTLEGWVEQVVLTSEGEYSVTQTVTNDFNGTNTSQIILRFVYGGDPVLTFITGEGSYVPDFEVDGYGGTAVKPEDPTRYGYIFDGWFTDTEYKHAFNWTTPVKADTTLYAKWVVDPSVLPEPDNPDEPGTSDGDGSDGDGKSWADYLWIAFAVLAAISLVAFVFTRNLYAAIATAAMALAAVATYLILGGSI